ncbi:fibronectin-like [Amphiura filiformis]|uniref:fibronectin-like n=1 Tax=Amphiura filiformis TaxID=82378 RepID=UPI003B219E25
MIEDTGVTSIEVSWFRNVNMDHFYLSWAPAHGNEEQPVTLGGDTSDFLITGLSPDTPYTIYLYAVTEGAGDGTQTISAPTILNTRTLLSLPGEIFIRSCTSSSVSVTWGAALPGTGFLRYRVSISPPDAIEDSSFVYSTEPDLFATFEGLNDAALYTITLTLEPGIETTTILQVTKPLPPTEVFSVPVITPISIRIAWHPSPSPDVYYEVTYSEQFDFNVILDGTVFGTDLEALLEGLTPSTVYDIAVRAVITRSGITAKSAPESVLESTRALAAGEIWVRGVTSTDVDLLIGSTNNPNALWYDLVLTNGATMTRRLELVDEDFQSTIFLDLLPGTEYEATLTIVLSGNANDPQTSTTFTTRPEATQIIEVDNAGPTFIEISWYPPFGNYDGFRLVYQTPDGPVEVFLSRNVFSYRLNFLDPGSSYPVELYTTVDSLDGVLESEAATIEPSTTILGELEIALRDLGTDFIEIVWGEVDDEDLATYIVTLNPVEGDNIGMYPEYRLRPDFTFENLVPGQLYTITVAPVYPDSTGSSEELLQRTTPLPPTDLDQIASGPLSLTLEWALPTEGVFDSLLLNYVEDGEEIVTLLPGDTTSFVVESLEPGTTYDFCLRTVSGAGETQQLSDIICIEDANTEILQPKQLLVQDYTSTRISVIWGAAVCVNAEYEVAIIPDNGGYNPSVEPGFTDYTFSGLLAGVEYVIELTCRCPLDDQTFTTAVIQRTSPVPPIRLQLSDKGVNFADLSWEDPIEINDYLEYEVRYAECGILAVNNRVTDGTNFRIDGLEGGTCYVVEVRTQAGIGPTATLSDPVSLEFTTDELRPLQIISTDKTDTTITLLWGDIERSDFTFYFLRQTPGSNTAVPLTTNTFTVSNLAPSTEYTFTLQTLLDNPPPVAPVEATFSTCPAEPGDITVDDRSFTTLTVSWTPSTSTVDYYLITYTPPNDAERVVATVPFDDDLETTIENLNPGTEYTIKVYAVNGELLSDPAQTVANTESVNEGLILVTDYSSETISTVWGARTQDDVILNRVTATTTYDGVEEVSSYSQSPGAPPRYTFTGLRPGQRYVLELTIQKELGADIVNEVVQYTRPEAPIFFFVGEVTKRCIQTIFEGPDSNYDDIRLTLFDEEGVQYGDVIILPPDTDEYKVCDLVPGSRFTLQVKTTIATDTGRIDSDVLEIETAETLPLEPLEITLLDKTTTRLDIAWGPSTDPLQSNYFIIADLTLDETDAQLITNTDDNVATLEGLIPGELYTVRVQAEPSQEESVAYLRTAPNQARNLRIAGFEVTATSISIDWDPPVTGVYDGFEIAVTGPDGVRRRVGRVRANVLEYIIHGLAVDTLYEVEVFALAGYNSEQECPSEPISQTRQTDTLGPLAIEIADVGTDSITVAWGPVPGDNVVYVANVQTVGELPYEILVDQGEPTVVTFNDLISGRLYDVWVNVQDTMRLQ